MIPDTMGRHPYEAGLVHRPCITREEHVGERGNHCDPEKVSKISSCSLLPIRSNTIKINIVTPKEMAYLERIRTCMSFGFTAFLDIVAESFGRETNKQMETHNSYLPKRPIKFI